MTAILPLSAQSSTQTDSVVVLMNATSLRQMEDEVGFSYREAIDARFLHNNTYLICDTAIWNVNTKIINAFGHVQILQDQTVLTSEKLDYYIDDNLAQFRGNTVQLMDKDGNTLRTRYLDYNTKDSIAVFERGASMKDKDGQVIESTDGTYESKEKLFTFDRNVNMYTDSVYVKTSRLLYHTDYDVAEFFGDIDAWKGGNMLSSESGTYDKSHERFFFTGDVHVMSDTQEAWSDSLYYERGTDNVEMYGNIQLTDSTRNVSALGNRLEYVDSLSRITIERDAAVIARTDQDGQVDTVYMGADKFIYRTVLKCDIDGRVVAAASKRLEDLGQDAVMAYRRKAAEEAAKQAEQAAEEAAKNDPNDPKAAAARREKTAKAEPVAGSIKEKATEVDLEPLKISQDDIPEVNQPEEDAVAPGDSLSAAMPVPPDSAAIATSLQDTLQTPPDPEKARRDSLASRDTTKIGFLTALHGVKAYKSDMQMSCDSLEYCDLDSLARMFISPIVWNEGNRQYSSDSISVAIKNQRMDKASLMSDAFIIIQEDSLCFDQIKATEILAYFDTTTALSRFDALGGASALFYLKENDVYATVNKVESKMLCAMFADGDIDRIFYFDSPKNDAYPVVQLPKEEKEMKGFNWQPDLRPEGKEDITPLTLRNSQRMGYLARPMPAFTETERYFPGHMESVRKMLASQDSLRRARHAEEEHRNRMAEIREKQIADSLESARLADSLAAVTELRDSSLTATSLRQQSDDSLSVNTVVPEVRDTIADEAGTPVRELTPAEIRKNKAAEAEARRQSRLDAREERWAILDARDAAKAAEKEARATAKRRQRTYEAVIAAEKENARDQKRLERYIRRYEKQKARKETRKQK